MPKTQVTKYFLISGLLLGMSAIPLGAQTSNPASPDQAQNPQTQQQQPDANNPNAPSTSAQPASPQQSVSPSQAVSQVQQSFQKDPTLSQSGVTVQSGDNNNLVLSGTVQSQADKDRAEQVARAASGGLSIDNKIQVSSSNTTPQTSTMPRR
jgi:osmotically-inducible protein OsmY